jgi:hypothetical protein
MKHVFKKSLIVAGVLACLAASSAFAQTVTTTPEQDKATQAAAAQQNKEYDKAHGYTNRAPSKARAASAVRKVRPADESWKEAVERDKATQAAAMEANREYDAARGYTNR